jgi:hypothetical protein
VDAKESLKELSKVDGFVAACIADSGSGMMLAAAGGGSEINIELAAAGNTEVMRAKLKTMDMLGLDDQIEDILITLGKQYHLIRPSSRNRGLFIYLVVTKTKANLAMSRMLLASVEKELAIG